MTLEKLTVKVEQNKDKGNNFTNVFQVLFNPNEITITKQGWQNDQHNNSFVASKDLITLSIELFFDTTLLGDPPPSVQDFTRKIFNLTQPSIGDSIKRPPLCQLVWGKISGKGNVLLSCGFLEQVTKKLTHFLEDGTPVRATMNCTFKEWIEPTKKLKILNPIDDPVRIVKRGETLSSISAEEYGDPTLWRIIADENRLYNPLKLIPGTVLTIPPL